MPPLRNPNACSRENERRQYKQERVLGGRVEE